MPDARQRGRERERLRSGEYETVASTGTSHGLLASTRYYDCLTIDPEDNTRCTDGAPGAWACSPGIYGDGACDCGCGAPDSDCVSAEESACDFCDAEGSCSEDECPGTINLTDNAVCTE